MKIKAQKKLIKFIKDNKLIEYKDGCIYTGMTKKVGKKLVPNGLGSATWPDQHTYKGQYKNGKFDGYGHYVVPGSYELIGTWKNNYLIKGEYKSENGNHYVGEFKKSECHGKGTMIYFNDHKYVGEWKDNIKHGKGKMTILIDDESRNWEKGAVFNGTWSKGREHGNFELIYPDGEIMDKVFVNGINTKSKFRDQTEWTVHNLNIPNS